ncbi:MAG: hypothetical protein NVSMB65_14980 [Chloroflexota bacterium]
MNGTRIRLTNGHVYDVREEYRTTGLRIREFEWLEFRALHDNAHITVRTSAIAALEALEKPARQAE